MDMLLTLLAVSGLAFGVQNFTGPFDIGSKVRNLLFRVPLIGPLFATMFACSFCMGFWSSVTVYFATGGSLVNLFDMGVWAFAGGMWNMALSQVLDKLASSTNTSG